ncbi:hypothetical protein NV379_12490 [Paenibacillus sp. N1-5-1-14]|uniref:hypothetical protein n=1 Tax=Paenibacillus radicibacter TaxID=2972488 RepID=UPI0021597831|nr:hypothetical protein [Paenibacillus radicibacter]MCR8643471.1 hypothetical protein [Paenibacillus radicibacter]
MWSKKLHTKSIEVLRGKMKNSLLLAVFFFITAFLASYVGTHLASGNEQQVITYVMTGMGLLLASGIFFMIRSMVAHSVVVRKFGM